MKTLDSPDAGKGIRRLECRLGDPARAADFLAADLSTLFPAASLVAAFLSADFAAGPAATFLARGFRAAVLASAFSAGGLDGDLLPSVPAAAVAAGFFAAGLNRLAFRPVISVYSNAPQRDV